MSAADPRAVSPSERAALGPGAAVSAWAALLVVLNVTVHPLVSGVAFTLLAWLALRAGLQRLLVLALLVGLGMTIAQPGIARVDGSFEFTYASGLWQLPQGGIEWARAVATVLRVPAQVLAVAFLALVPAPLLLAGASRLSASGALLGGLAARLHPLLGRDVATVREELASRGLRVAAPAPFGERVRAAIAIWEVLLGGMLDRAFGTSAALQTRGFGVTARPTTAPLTDPRLARGAARSPARDRAIVVLAACSVLLVVVARATGGVEAPTFGVFGGYAEPVTPVAAALALLLALLIALPGAALRARTPGAPVVAGSGDAPATPLLDIAAPRRPSPARYDLPPALSVVAVGMTYPGRIEAALADVSFTLAPGELVVVSGASGSGKSTLLDVVTGVAPATSGGRRSGRVQVGGIEVDGLGGTHGAVAAVFQEPEAQVLVGTVAEEVAFGLRHRGLDIATIERAVVDALRRVDLLHLARRDCATLSGGELQRVLLAAALALDPVVLVLDEPTSQVDAHAERRFWDAVDAARARGIAVLAAEHRLDHVLERCDRVLVFSGGRLVASMPASEARDAGTGDADPFVGLVPTPVRHGARPRLAVSLDRLDVGGSRTLLRGLRFAVPPGAIVTLEGPNGSGKSTLLRTLRGLQPAVGTVSIDGFGRGDVAGSVHRIAWLSQRVGAMLPGQSVRDAATELSHRLGIDAAPAVAAVGAAGLGDRLDSHPAELSVGERQRLALVATTAHGAAVWLLDEPTRGMDVHARRWVACQVLAHAAAGGVVLIATHDPALAAAVATHRLRLDLRTGPSLMPVARTSSGAPLVGGSAPAPAAPLQAPGEAAPWSR